MFGSDPGREVFTPDEEEVRRGWVKAVGRLIDQWLSEMVDTSEPAASSDVRFGLSTRARGVSLALCERRPRTRGLLLFLSDEVVNL